MRRQLRSSGSSVLNLDPLADALRHGSEDGVRAVEPALIARPGLQLRLAVTALRAGVLRFVTEDGTIVESDAHTPAPGAAAGPVDLVDGAIASASVPMVFPPHPMADDDYVDGGVIEIVPVSRRRRPGGRPGSSPWWPCRSGCPATTATTPRRRPGYIGLRSMGMIGVAERQISNLNVRLPGGHHAHDGRPRGRRGRALRDRAGAPAHQQGLRLAARRRPPGRAEADADIRADIADGTHAIVEARREAWRLEESLWAAGRIGEGDAGTLALVREHKEQIRALVDRRKQLGFPVPDGCEDWWTGYEAHTAERPQGLPAFSSGRA